MAGSSETPRRQRVSARFSERTAWDRTPSRLAEGVARRRAAGEPVLDLTDSNPTRVGLAYPNDLLAALADPGGLAYRPEPFGLRETREAVARDFARRGVSLDADRVVLTASSSESYAWLLKLLCDPGDSLLVPRPSYPLFDFLARLEAVELKEYPLSFDGLWHVEPERVRAAVEPRTRAVCVVSPNNPTGSWLDRAGAGALRELCAERGLPLICDEVFADFPLDPRADRQPSLADDGPGLCFSLGGLSKACGLPQSKLGWVAVSGPAPARREALERLELIADTYLSVGTPVQRAAPGLLARRDETAGPIRTRLAEARDALASSLSSPDCPVSLLRVEGGWSAVLRVPATLDDEARAERLLERHGVLAHPGRLFGFDSGAHLVVSLLTRPADLERGVARLLEDLAGVL